MAIAKIKARGATSKRTTRTKAATRAASARTATKRSGKGNKARA